MNIDITLPKSWGEVTLAKFEELSEAVTKYSDNPWELTAHTISVLSGVDYTEVKSWPVSVLQSKELSEALEFIKKDPKKRMPMEKITLRGNSYTLKLYPQNWTAGQWLDYTTVSKDESDVKKMARLIACFTVPRGKEYGKDYDFDTVVDDINDGMDVETALGLSGFFQLLFGAFTKALVDYSVRKLKKAGKSTPRPGSRSNKKTARTQNTQQSGQAS